MSGSKLYKPLDAQDNAITNLPVPGTLTEPVRLQDLNDTVTALTTYIDGQVVIINAEIDTVEADVTTLQGDVSVISGSVSDAQADIVTLQSDVGTLQTDVGAILAGHLSVQTFNNAGSPYTIATSDMTILNVVDITSGDVVINLPSSMDSRVTDKVYYFFLSNVTNALSGYKLTINATSFDDNKTSYIVNNGSPNRSAILLASSYHETWNVLNRKIKMGNILTIPYRK